MAGKRKSMMQGGAPLQWAAVGGLLHMRLEDAAAELNVPITYLRRLCRQNGFPQWPGKKIRYMNKITGKNVMLGVDAGLAGPSHLAKIISETKKEEEDSMASNGMHEPVANHLPGEELTTLNLIDKVGSSSAPTASAAS